MKIKAYAKLNLTLDICGKRKDGYHLIDSVMASADPFDIVDIEKAEKTEVICSDSKLSSKENIAFKAAVNFFEYTGLNCGARIFIEKNIPQAAGLGGGSTDAAAVIRGLDRLYSTDLNKNELYKIALSVGADVPFCIYGGTARVGGIGETVETVRTPQNLFLVIAKNGVKKSTKDMYNKLDSIKEIKENYTDSMINAINNDCTEKIISNISNAFIEASGLYGMEEILKNTNYSKISLSGSGPSVFAVYNNSSDALKALELLKSENIESFYAQLQDKGIVFE